MNTTRLSVPESHSLSTAVHIEKMLAAIPGVQSASVELVRGSISVLHDGVDPDELKRAVISAGVPAELAGD